MLFVWNRLPVEIVGAITMAALVLTGQVTTAEALSGFANEATIVVALMLVLSAGLLQTGAVDLVGRRIGRAAGESELRLLAVIIALVVPVSAILNNTAVVAVLVPTVVGLAREREIAPSRILMPLSFASQMGGTLTLIGTSTNLLVAGIVLSAGADRITLFEMTGAAALVAIVGIAYLLTVGRWLVPVRRASEDLLKQYELRDYLTGLVVDSDSPMAGRSLRETRFGEETGLQVVAVEREGERISWPTGDTVLRAHDFLLVTGKVVDIAQVKEIGGVSIAGGEHGRAVPRGGGEDGEGEGPTESSIAGLAEVMVTPRSHTVGHTLRELNFRGLYRVTAVAIQRHGRAILERVERVRLQPGDVLLVQGTPESLAKLHEAGDLALLGQVAVPARRRSKMRIAVAIMLGVVAAPAFGLTTIVVSALLGAIAMVLTGCIRPEEAYEEMDWSVIILLGTILPLGIAMQKSGAAELLASGVLGVTAEAGPYASLAAFYLLTAALTAVISNAAAAVVLTPMALAAGASMGMSPLPFVIAVMLAASNSYLTPIGYQTNVFIYGPGGYRFADFLRVGGPLTVISLAVATFVIPIFFPFHAP